MEPYTEMKKWWSNGEYGSGYRMATYMGTYTDEKGEVWDAWSFRHMTWWRLERPGRRTAHVYDAGGGFKYNVKFFPVAHQHIERIDNGQVSRDVIPTMGWRYWTAAGEPSEDAEWVIRLCPDYHTCGYYDKPVNRGGWLHRWATYLYYLRPHRPKPNPEREERLKKSLLEHQLWVWSEFDKKFPRKSA
jgi:hypothetical protein